MPTGEAHDRVVNSIVDGEFTQEAFPCRCMIGSDHIEGADFPGEEPFEEDEVESFAGAEEIYDSSGRDEDYDFR